MGQPPVAYPAVPPGLQKKSRIMKALGRAYLQFFGWRIEGGFPSVSKFVTIVAPHTSNWDFTLGLAAKAALEFHVSWLGKHTIFRRPFRGLLRRLGGIPVDRRASHGSVDACVEAFAGAPAMALALAPEGTRHGVSRWRSGFYRIAVGAGVPIFPIGFDFGDRVIRLMPVFSPTGDFETDLPRIQELFTSVRGRNLRIPSGGVDPRP